MSSKLSSNLFELYETAFKSGIERSAEAAQAWLHVPTMKLRAGEMTAGEVRAVKAVVGRIVAEIRALK